MLHKRLHCLHYFHWLWRLPTVRCVLIILACQGVPPYWRVEASDDPRKPVVLLGDVKSRKNYVAAALLGAKFSAYDDDYIPVLTLWQDERDAIETKYGKGLLKLEHNPFTRRIEKTVLYDHPDLRYPFYNVRGFGKSGLASFFQRDLNTEEAHASLQEILKRPMRGFLLHVHLMDVKACRKRSSLEVMDFLLPYFKDAEAVEKYLVPSFCLVITGFNAARHMGFGMYDVTNAGKQRTITYKALRQSMQKCYTDWYGAEKGTEQYVTLAKQKALYDALLQNPAAIQPDADNHFALDDFELDLTKVIAFDPCDSVGLFHTDKADTTQLEAAMAMFKGIPAAALVQDEEGHRHWLWAVPVVGAAVYGWSWSQDSAGDENQDKEPRRGSRKSMREDDDDTDDAIPEPPTSQAPQPPQTPVDHVT